MLCYYYVLLLVPDRGFLKVGKAQQFLCCDTQADKTAQRMKNEQCCFVGSQLFITMPI